MEDLQVKVSWQGLPLGMTRTQSAHLCWCVLHCADMNTIDVERCCCVQINALQAQNQRLMAHVGEVEAHKGMLTGQVTTLRSKWSNASNDNMRLQAELGTLRKTLQVHPSPLLTCMAVAVPFLAELYLHPLPFLFRDQQG